MGLERDKETCENRIRDLQMENGVYKRQLEQERQRYADLEIVLQNERKGQYEGNWKVRQLEKSQDELQSENERLHLRVNSKIPTKLIKNRSPTAHRIPRARRQAEQRFK